MTDIPKNAREVYCNEKGEPIAYCPVDSIGVSDLQRAQFYNLNEARLAELAVRARQKQDDPEFQGERFCVVCIDVDDPMWTWLVDILMPGFYWQGYRDRGERPVARGVIPLQPVLAQTIAEAYPAAGELHDDAINIVVFAAGGIAIIPEWRTS